MKRIVFIVFFLIVVFLSFYFFKNVFHQEKKEVKSVSSSIVFTPTPKLEIKNSTGKEEKSLFVPYWSIGQEEIKDTDYDRLIYFGITVNKNGVDKEDAGYANLDKFIINTNKEKFLTLRMIKSDLNFTVLKDKNLQEEVISESIDTSKKYSFDGLVLNFEIAAIPFDSVVNEISNFIGNFYKSSKQNDLKFLVAVYGDTFYRARPLNIDYIDKNSDGILIMAYDFHKARGNPGPNFPLMGQEKYGYDFKMMIDDFVKASSPDKLSVIFGMYGYDWMIDREEKSIKQAESLSFNKIKQDFLDNCAFKNCDIKKDKLSSETKIEYTDSDSNRHIIWFENMESVNKKIQYLNSRGINSISFWAYSYF